MKDNNERARKADEMVEEVAIEWEYKGFNIRRVPEYPHLVRVTALGTSSNSSLDGSIFKGRESAFKEINKLLGT